MGTVEQAPAAGTPEWHEERRKGIGGSDAAAVLGVDPWRTSMDVWQEKIRPYDPDRDVTTEAMKWGTLLEPVIRREASKAIGDEITEVNGAVYREHLPFVRANLDGYIEDVRGKGPAIVQIKTTRSRIDWGRAWTDEIPVHYRVQVTHEMVAAGVRFAVLPVLFGGNNLEVYGVEFDEDLGSELIDAESEFWGRVQEEIPPVPRTGEDVEKLYARHEPHQWAQSDSLTAFWIRRIQETKERLAFYEGERERLEGELKKQIGECEGIVDAKGEKLATWRSQSSSRIDAARLRSELPDVAREYSKESTSRRLLIKTPKF